ncbi:uncharacterized protein LOC105923895 isoform X4 [Fundulus heteroclitus]|uniref:uncharacterized protein LOC105923895 isoform X4 n=1 Tax=Fundulus heteroclitus TaxID=8078 RepID=UPI00165AE8B1|nr:uncharacterized protein LOC105923895 isoform X4 [Fundulus heteroclitus]
MAVCAQTILSYRNRLQKVEKEKKELVAQVQHLQRGLSVSKRVIAGLCKSGAVAINQPVLRSSKRKRAQVPQGAGQASAPKKAAPPQVDRTPGPATAKSASPAERRTKVSSTVVS